MHSTDTPDPARTLQILWGALLGSVSLLGGVIWFLATQVELTAVSPEILQMILLVGFLSPLPYLLVKMAGRRDSDGSGPSPSHADEERQKTLQRFIVGASLAELPAMFAIVYTALGGELDWAFLLWGISLVLLLAARPSTTRII
ncbi:MAG: hypothetical protein ABW079_00720 [Sedimenticola sp.]